MKKKLLMILLATAMIFTACGSRDEDAQYLKDVKASKYVTLGDYMGVEVSFEEYLDGYIDYVLQNSPVPVTDRTVEEGDIVNIDFIGKLDGVAFDGGTGEGYDLTIGSGQFIEGFEDGCIGMEIGETRDVDAVFPDPYLNNPNLAGKTAVFTVTVNSIQEIPELTDEYVQGLGLEDCSNVEEYKKYLYYNIILQDESNFQTEKEGLVYAAVADACEFKEPPKGIVSRMYNTIYSNISNYSAMYGIDVGTYVEAVYGGTADDYEATLMERASIQAQHYLMFQAIADQEGLNVSDEELQEELAQSAESYGYETVEEYSNLIDVDAFQEYLMTQKVLEFISDNAVIIDPV